MFDSSSAIARRPAALAGRVATAVEAEVVEDEVEDPDEVDEADPTRVAPVEVAEVVGS